MRSSPRSPPGSSRARSWPSSAARPRPGPWTNQAWPFTGQLTNLHQGVEVLHEGGSVDLPEGTSDTKTMRWFTDHLLEFVERHREEPFLAVIHTGDPHAPYEPMGHYADL